MYKKKREKDTYQWDALDGLAHNAVVQVFAQVAPFNWIQPYRIESPFESRGSGFFITADGHFVTDAHVINDARRIWIHVPALGRIPLPATVVGICPELDIALARLHADAAEFVIQKLGSISYFECGDSDKIRPTEMVLALGYPLGQNHLKSSTGVVSGREFIDGRPVIQITAPVNPGSSGGPVIGAHGKVIGITVSGILGAQSVGYVIPIHQFITIYDELMAGGLVRRPKWGLHLGYANDEKAAYFNNPEPAGLYITSVIPGSLCDKAGVRDGDMLYELNGYLLDAYGESDKEGVFGRVHIYDLIVALKTGQKVTMVIYRNGKRIPISFNYDMQDPLPIRKMYAGYEPVDYEVMGGLVLMSLTDNHIDIFADSAPHLLAYSWPKKRSEGVVLITYIFPGSYVYRLYSLMPGDIIYSVNDIRIVDVDSFRQALYTSIDTGLIAIKTDNDIVVVLSLEKILRDEERLSADFIYPLSLTIKQLQQAAVQSTLKKRKK